MKKKIKRIVQFATGIHRIHHIRYSYGWKIPILRVAYFTDRFEHLGNHNHGWKSVKDRKYHNCTVTGVY